MRSCPDTDIDPLSLISILKRRKNKPSSLGFRLLIGFFLEDPYRVDNDAESG